MKFGKNLASVVEFSEPEWSPYWMNYKFLKKKINDIADEEGFEKKASDGEVSDPTGLKKSSAEIDFFKLLRRELQKVNDFFKAEEALFKIRRQRVMDGFLILQRSGDHCDKATWTRLTMACVKFYEDVLLLENFAIMNYCGFSKILKKHDKRTGYNTREAFMRKIMDHQCFTHHETLLQMLQELENLFKDIQNMKNCFPLHDEERLFIEAIRDLNYQASRLRAEENSSLKDTAVYEDAGLTVSSRLFPHARTISTDSQDIKAPLDALEAAVDTLSDAAKKSYMSQPNLNSAISWITNVTNETPHVKSMFSTPATTTSDDRKVNTPEALLVETQHRSLTKRQRR